MSIKVVILFQQLTDKTGVLGSTANNYVPRDNIGGWSESVYYDSNDVGALTQDLKNGSNGVEGLLPTRAALLPKTATIVGVRLYQGGAGKGQSLALQYPGYDGFPNDIPQMAMLVKAGNSTAAVARRFTLRGVPDSMVEGGLLTVTTAYGQRLQKWRFAMTNFAFRALDLTAPKLPIFNITNAGLITLNGAANPFVVGDVVRIEKTKDAIGNFVTDTKTVKSIGPQNGQLTVEDWTHGACGGGTLTQKRYTLYGFNSGLINIVRIVTRKVGRPFEQYRGRRSKRRKTL